MKKAVVVLLLAAIAAGVFFYLRRPHAGGAATVAGFLPADTFALVHFSDWAESSRRFKESDLYQLWREPEIQAFLQRPLSHAAEAKRKISDTATRLEKLAVRNAFVAATQIS